MILLQDCRYALRMLARNPGFTAAAVLALALGIGLNTAIFSVVNAVLLRTVSFPQPDRLMTVWEKSPTNPRNSVSPGNFLDWQRQNHVFESMAAIYDSQAALTGRGEPEQVSLQAVTPGLFPLLGMRPILGRTFTNEEARVGGPRLIVIGYRFWQRKFGLDRAAIGQTLRLDGDAFEVIGVMPPGFQPLEGMFNESNDGWIPMRLDPARDYRKSSGRYMVSMARLKSGVTPAQAQAEMTAIASRLEREYPDFDTNWGVNVLPWREQQVGSLRPLLIALLCAVGLVLLIACANVANLLLARSVARQREISIREALGAARWRLVRQMLTESLILAGAACGIGVVLAAWGIPALLVLSPKNLPRMEQVGISTEVLAFTVGISLLTGILFGLAPALTATAAPLNEALKEAGRGLAGSSPRNRLRQVLVAGELALSVMLLAGAGLLIRSFVRLQAQDPGFRAEHVLTVKVSRAGDGAKSIAYFKEAVERVASLPGVVSAGAVTFLPFDGIVAGTDFTVNGRPPLPPGQNPVADIRIALPGYFPAMGIPILRGRGFTEREGVDPAARRVFLISESLAKRDFPNQDPMGQKMEVSMGSPDNNPMGEVIGIIGDTRQVGLDVPAKPTVYYPMAQLPIGFMTIVARTASDPNLLARATRTQISRIDPTQPVPEVKTMDDLLSASISRWRFQMVLLTIFAGAALLLAAIGLYGTVSYLVNQRMPELGIRAALGATPGGLLAMMLRQTGRLTLIGVGAGVAGALLLSRFLASLLFEVRPNDPATLASVTLLMAAVSLLAAYIPARRATRVDVMQTLRHE
jgi:putative ABC transport system permease protein